MKKTNKKTKKINRIKVYAAGLALGTGLGLASCNELEQAPETSEIVSELESEEVSEIVSEEVETPTEEVSNIPFEDLTPAEQLEIKYSYDNFPTKEEIPAELLDENGIYQPVPVTKEQLEAKIVEMEKFYRMTDGDNEDWFNEDVANDIYTMLCLNRPFISDEDLNYILDEYSDLLSNATSKMGTIRTYSNDMMTMPLSSLVFDRYLQIQTSQLDICATILDRNKRGYEIYDEKIIKECEDNLKDFANSRNYNVETAFQFNMADDIDYDINKTLILTNSIISGMLPVEYLNWFIYGAENCNVLFNSPEYSFTRDENKVK